MSSHRTEVEAADGLMERPQLVAVCQVLTNWAGYADLWSCSGPSEPACLLRDELHRAGDSIVGVPSDAVLVRLAWDVWNGTGAARVDQLIEHLSPDRLVDVGRLLAALGMGSTQVAEWLKSQGVRHG